MNEIKAKIIWDSRWGVPKPSDEEIEKMKKDFDVFLLEMDDSYKKDLDVMGKEQDDLKVLEKARDSLKWAIKITKRNKSIVNFVMETLMVTTREIRDLINSKIDNK